MKISTLKLSIFCITSVMMCNTLHGQICDNKFLSVKLKGLSFDTITNCTFNNNEALCIGQIRDYNNAAHIAKFSAKGTPIWSNTYAIDYFSFYPPTFFQTVYLKKIIPTIDGGYLVAGNFDKVLSPFGLPPPVKKYALLAKIDKFGVVMWSKTWANNSGNLNCSTVYETTDGDFIVYLGTDNGKKVLNLDHSYSKIARLDNKGNLKWSTLIFTNEYDAGGLGLDFKQAITQTKNKNIILGHVVYKAELYNAHYNTVRGNLHFISFDYATGKMKWESSYEYPVPVSDSLYTPDIVNVEELPDGRLSFISTLYLSTSSQPVLTKKGVTITTNNKGEIEDLIAYSPTDGSDCRIIDATAAPIYNNRTLLFRNGAKSLLTNINSTGQINWNIGYNTNGGVSPLTCLSKNKKGFNLFMSTKTSFYSQLLITDSAGIIDCANEPATIIAKSAAFDFPHDSVTTNTSMNLDAYYDYQLPFKRIEAYPLQKEIICEQATACCTDFIDSTHLKICEGKKFMLPDGTIVKDSGNYYSVTKSPLGCDSIKFYHINIDKDISKLNLGLDSCLTQSATITLLATAGYSNYYWGNSTTAGTNSYNINMPGYYKVRVSNTCGTKTDSIIIYDRCDYPIYMPGAFSPNNDGINDYYGISQLNKNRLISFKIFNRWGQLIFKTSNPNEKWDGRFRNEALQFGTFIYYIEMAGLSGNRIVAKGSFILLR
ncbi:gliding motility-associated C-terminal domain-containing protein [Ferruginibacter sp.]|nr:gliding motility-associated C-terminal domain-containing protein [Ferruginibacter sp.]